MPVSGEVFTIFVEHGKNPAGADYAYFVAPSAKSAASPPRIIANTRSLQAVETADLAGLAFYAPGEVETSVAGKITAEQPCVVLVRKLSGQACALTVADPTTKLSKISLRVGKRLLEFDLPEGERAGASVTKPTPIP